MKIWKREYYEKLLTTHPKTVHDYELQILLAKEQIKKLQEKCTHKEYEVLMYSYRVGALQPSHVCKFCNVCLGEATPEESELLWKEWRGEK